MPIKGILGPIAIGEVVSRVLIRRIVTEVMEPAIVSDVEHFGLVFKRSFLATTGLTMFTTLGQVTESTDLGKASLDLLRFLLLLERFLTSDFMSGSASEFG